VIKNFITVRLDSIASNWANIRW